MKFLADWKLFELLDIEQHLSDRGIDPKKTRVVRDGDDTYFFLYNLSGQMIGYQKYNPLYPKTGQGKLSDPRMAKYFTWVSGDEKNKAIACWGLESVDVMNDEFIFITEGIFDCVRIHQAGLPGIAVLCNDPNESLKNWLWTLPQKKIVIYDNDAPGRKLIKVADYAFSVTGGKDLGDLTKEEAKVFLEDCITKIKSGQQPHL